MSCPLSDLTDDFEKLDDKDLKNIRKADAKIHAHYTNKNPKYGISPANHNFDISNDNNGGVEYLENPIYRAKTDNILDIDVIQPEDYDGYYLSAIEQYTGSFHYDMNKALRAKAKGLGSIPGIDEDATEIANILKEALYKYPPNFTGTMYRGTRFKPEQLNLINNLKQGDILQNDSILSTTSKFSKSNVFGYFDVTRGVKYGRITIRGKGHDISYVSKYTSEAEVLVKPGSNFQVLDIVETPIRVEMLLEEVPEQVMKLMPNIKINKDVLSLFGIAALTAASVPSEASISPANINPETSLYRYDGTKLDNEMLRDAKHILYKVKNYKSKDRYKALIVGVEGFGNKSYNKDGHLTIPLGSTADRHPQIATDYPKGSYVPKEVALKYYEMDKKENLNTLKRLAPPKVFKQLNANQKAALMSLIHEGALGPKATKLLKEGKVNTQEFYEEAFGSKSAMLANDKYLRGMHKRRYIEGHIFVTPISD